MDSSRECRHATCPAISPGCERCVTSRNRSPSSPPDPVNSLRPRKRRADPSIAAVHACPNAPTRAVNQPYSLPHRRNTGRAQPTATRNTRIPVSREIYFYDIHSQVELRLLFCPTSGVRTCICAKSQLCKCEISWAALPRQRTAAQPRLDAAGDQHRQEPGLRRGDSELKKEGLLPKDTQHRQV